MALSTYDSFVAQQHRMSNSRYPGAQISNYIYSFMQVFLLTYALT